MNRGLRGRVIAAIAVFFLGAVTIALTAHLADEEGIGWLTAQETRIIAAEMALFGILLIELVAGILLVRFHRSGSLQMGIAVRAVLRLVAYLILLVSVVSILASNPALAVGVGSVTGVVIAFSAQNLIANAFAGMFLAIGRPFKVGETITVMGVTGRVADIRVMHTLVDLGDRIALVPSNAMMAQVIQRPRRERSRMEWEEPADPE